MNNNVVFDKTDDFVYRDIGGECILVPVRKNIADLNSLFTLNEVAGKVFQLFDGSTSVLTIEEAILSEYDVSREILQHDVKELMSNLLEIGAIKKV